MTLAEKITRAKTDYDDVFDAGYEKGKAEGGGSGGVAVQEIVIASEVYNTSQLADILFNNMDITKYMLCAALTRPKNNTLINNQVVMLSVCPKGNSGFRFRNGEYGQIMITSEYDAAVTIGDIYTVYCVGEFSYGN